MDQSWDWKRIKDHALSLETFSWWHWTWEWLLRGDAIEIIATKPPVGHPKWWWWFRTGILQHVTPWFRFRNLHVICPDSELIVPKEYAVFFVWSIYFQHWVVFSGGLEVFMNWSATLSGWVLVHSQICLREIVENKMVAVCDVGGP